MRETFQNNIRGLLGNGLNRLESASLRHNKFLFIGGNSQREQLEAVAKTASRHSITPVPQTLDEAFELALGGRLIVNMSGGVLENAGLALHRHFNCPYIPGSALKGIARHAAWCEWKNAAEEDKERIDAETVRIFGSPVSEAEGEDHYQGAVCFMSSFPKSNTWDLTVDVLTPHGGNDYTNPVPCFFLAVERGAVFRFGVRSTGRARPGESEQAALWLRQGLNEHGIGAKTVSGYGWFHDEQHSEMGINVELVSPGFFGGASHENGMDTTLRAASLRGMLRWWWRTLYRDILSEAALKQLEDAVWGSTEGAGWIRTRVLENKPVEPRLFDYKDGFRPEKGFAQQHSINPGDHGLHYMAYGMDEKSRGEVRQRWYCPPGSSWAVVFSLRNHADNVTLCVGKEKIEVSAETLIKQAKAALSLLCRYGGVGSKSRNGFGSLQWEDAMDLDECRDVARQLYSSFELNEEVKSDAYSWEAVVHDYIDTPCRDPWTVLDRLGLAVKTFAAQHKHRQEKAVLGLPRKIHGPRRDPMRYQNPRTHQPPQNLEPDLQEARNGTQSRFASPVWYHLEHTEKGIRVRIAAFPSAMIRPLHISKAALADLVQHIVTQLENADWTPPAGRPHGRSGPGRKPAHRAQQSQSGLTAGQEIRAVLLEKKTKKGGWRVCPIGSQLNGPVVNSADIPGDKQAGDEITVLVHSPNPQSPMFRFKSKG